ncbi:MAG TPA: riboflavin synthase [Epulopiscium sp.]|nr:riboflavin synthase [Candidatus Epulonipiscium sp.]
MFTGIVEEVGIVQSLKQGSNSKVITISGDMVFQDLRIGDSVAVNGVCVTVISLVNNSFLADIMHETLRCSSLGSLKKGSHVNLERAVANNGRFGGHIVSGHIDGTGEILKIKQEGNAIWYTIKVTSTIMKYIIEKGSIAIDGISLTVAKVSEKDFSVSIIPHTMKATNLLEKCVGERVNLENDIVGKYIEKFINPVYIQKPESKITQEFLQEFGY